MPLLSEKNFEELASFDNSPCISIFIPTQTSGHEVLNEKSRIQLKSQWKKVYEKLKELDIPQDKIDQLGSPIEGLLEDSNFWRHQSHGLAIFISENFFKSYNLPISFKATTYVSDHFYLKPLIPMFSGNGRFYLLAIQPDKVRLYEADRYSISELDIEELVPNQLEDRVGYDYEEKSSKRKLQNSSRGSFTQHGYAPASRDERNEILEFFRSVDKGIHSILNDETAPLLLACQDYLLPIYQEATKYKNLYPKCVSGNPSADNPDLQSLHKKAVEVMEPYFNKEKKESMTAFKELNPERTSTSVTDIIPALFQGKVETLFLQNQEDIWGTYNKEMATVDVNDKSKNGNISLMNLAAVKAIEQKGKVYLIERQFMPTKDSTIVAVYRY